ncbi:MAG: S-methyl-5'-thioinosine phosphorylase [Candidatus Accumulibacter sp.]|jgi:5'-methylthioadenosine phosphorylase|nr:S-methyl-5'-thioinosine phosphorylase [Accumulibacter sp.]
MLAVIGGSGLTQLPNLELTRREVVRTPYGEPSSALAFGRIRGQEVAFLARHGSGHTIPAHAVNYRANVWALVHRGAKAIVAVATVGGIRPDLAPGGIVIPHQIIDYTWGRKNTYHDGNGSDVVHIDFTHPYDSALRARLIEAARAAGVAAGETAVYAATQGPRLETAAEIDRIERDGGEVVGMTAMPEAVLARELGAPYAAINVVVNHAAGRADSRDCIRFDSAGIEAAMAEAMIGVRAIIEKLAENWNDHGHPAGA